MKIEGTHQLNVRARASTSCWLIQKFCSVAFPAASVWKNRSGHLLGDHSRRRWSYQRRLSRGLSGLKICAPPEHYRIVVDGKGAPGFLKGSGDLDLEEQG